MYINKYEYQKQVQAMWKVSPLATSTQATKIHWGRVGQKNNTLQVLDGETI